MAGIRACASLGQPPGLGTDGVTLMAEHVLSDPAITLKAKNTLNILAKADGITQKANPTKADDITLKAKANDITLKAKNMNDSARVDGITLEVKAHLG